MKYQKLENQEANWKWIYLIRKYREGENITCYEERSLQEAKSQELLACQHYPEKIEAWIKNHLSPQHTKKKSIDLEYAVWQRLSRYSRKMKMTLSETITYMIDERESKAQVENQMAAMKNSLKNLLK